MPRRRPPPPGRRCSGCSAPAGGSSRGPTGAGWTRWGAPRERGGRGDSLEAAAAAVAGFAHVFLTTGRTGLGAFAGLTQEVLVRTVDPPEPPLPLRTTVVLERGPFTVGDELALMREHAVDVVVTKDSGSRLTEAKLAAARELGIPVVVGRAPPLPAGGRVVDTGEEAMDWLRARDWPARASPARLGR